MPVTKKIYHILWTSGWDSTFRLADLVLIKGKTVQPVYVIDEQRPSTHMEMKKMQEILDLIYSKDDSARDRILPTIRYKTSEIPKNEKISSSLKTLNKQSYLGSQYVFLARMALHHNMPDLELCIHKDDKAHQFLEPYVTNMIDIEGEPTFKLKETSGSLELETLFNYFQFPIFEMTKLEMDIYARKHGFSDIMENTWFCHTPLRNNKVCGQCNPCKYTREEGLARRVPKPAFTDKIEYNAGRVFRKIRSILNPQ